MMENLWKTTDFSYASGFQDGNEMVVKEVLAGDSVHSLLSILDVITVSLLLSLL